MKRDRQKQLWAALLAVEGIGRGSLKKILKQLESLDIPLEDFWQRKPAQIWELCQLTASQQTALRDFQQRFSPEGYYGWLKAQGINTIISEDKEYPKLLNQIEDKPLVLYTKGSLSGVNQRPIAVVGTRQISGYGRNVIEQIVPDLVAYHVSIVSGFMYGVDTYAHQQAVKHDGYTVGILGFGFNHMYPAGNHQFFQEMLAKGNGFVTEYPPWVGSHRSNFPQRNRIVAGMSLAVVVIEAAVDSGSHITAGYAGDYGRGVCAVPGPITSKYSEGTKNLINLGARLVGSAGEILEEAGVFQSGWSQLAPDENGSLQLCFADTLQEKIYQSLLNGSATTDELARQLQLSISTLNTNLSLLELEGYVVLRNGIWLAKTPSKLV